MHRLFCVLHLAFWTAAATLATCAAGAPAVAYDLTVRAPGGAAVRLHAEEHGHGPAVLLLHGLAGSTYSWRFVAPRLAAAGFRVIALDLKGFGLSEKPLDPAYSPGDQAALVRAFMTARGLTGAHVVGHSMGGLVGLALAQDGASTIGRLILINTPAFPQDLTPALVLMQQPVLPHVLLALMPADLPVAIGLGLEAGDFGSVRRADVVAYARPLDSAGGRHALITTAGGLTAASAVSFTSAYARLATPTLVMACLDDGIVPPATAVRLARTLPNATLKLLEGCRHLAPEQAPETVASAIAGFVRR